jgi:hypothetical protein
MSPRADQNAALQTTSPDFVWIPRSHSLAYLRDVLTRPPEMKNHPDELAALCPDNGKSPPRPRPQIQPTIDPNRHD